ncbi:hypothetical protein CY34DRAFT_562614 [Suillus luteus UH-Slu-Lm8-n1]|uniref:Uncharacterized protein n=1 Tax=Suillus luteus UH-Slu-Lm8-n1 TaxID=930992 RepID=A0A0C9ZDT2_9AGAM|nr:hypothetical protein CY34DRAFT_562614 [Suillus luteus UH-Slu-Lm8-n1]
MSVNRPPALALSALSGTSSNQCSLSYPALKYNESLYKYSRQLTLRVCGVLLFQHTDEDSVFAKRVAQMADSSFSLRCFIHLSHSEGKRMNRATRGSPLREPVKYFGIVCRRGSEGDCTRPDEQLSIHTSVGVAPS